mgnify:CR=1 FL=1
MTAPLIWIFFGLMILSVPIAHAMLGGVAAALQVEGFHQLPETAGGHDQVFLGHLDVVEEDVGRGNTPEPHQPFPFPEA